MRSKASIRDRRYRNTVWVKQELLRALGNADEKNINHVLGEFLNFGSTSIQGRIFGVPERTLRRLSRADYDPKLSLILKVIKFLNH